MTTLEGLGRAEMISYDMVIGMGWVKLPRQRMRIGAFGRCGSGASRVVCTWRSGSGRCAARERSRMSMDFVEFGST